jgi:hypothetical protein
LIVLSLLTEVGPDLYKFESIVHGRSFDLAPFSLFVLEHVPIISVWSRSSHYLNNKPIIQLIASGQLNLWDYEDIATENARSEVFIKYGPIFSHQQATERANKDQNVAASHNRGETNIKARLCGQALLRELCATVLNGDREAYRGKPKFEKMLGLLESFNARVRRLKDEIGPDQYDTLWRVQRAGLDSSYTSLRLDNARAQIDNILSEPHVPSARERVSGYDESAATLGLLQFGKLFTPNLSLLRDEWKGRKSGRLGRPLTFAETLIIEKTGLRDVKQAIKKHEAERERQEGEVHNEKFFKPLFTDREHYKFNLI